MSQGWIKLYRSLLTSTAWTTASDKGKVILITLLLRASHAATVWRVTSDRTAKVLKTVPLNPGQLYTNYKKLAQEFDTTTRQITTELTRLENIGVIKLKTNHSGTLITFLNWERFQGISGNDIGTVTYIETRVNPVNKRVSEQNTASAVTNNDSNTEMRFASYNKNIYLLIKNNTNKKELNNRSFREAAFDSSLCEALRLYEGIFPNKDNKLSDEETFQLQCITAMLGGDWIRKAVYELKAAMSEKKIRRPGKYLLGIIQNWLSNGMPNDSKGRRQELDDFYKAGGIGQ